MNNKNMLLSFILVVILSMMMFGCTEGKAFYSAGNDSTCINISVSDAVKGI